MTHRDFVADVVRLTRLSMGLARPDDPPETEAHRLMRIRWGGEVYQWMLDAYGLGER